MRDQQGMEHESSNAPDSACETTGAVQHDADQLNNKGDDPAEPAEYSDEFAEMILEAAAGEFEEIDIDAFLAELHRQIAKLREEERNRQSNEGPT